MLWQLLWILECWVSLWRFEGFIMTFCGTRAVWRSTCQSSCGHVGGVLVLYCSMGILCMFVPCFSRLLDLMPSLGLYHAPWQSWILEFTVYPSWMGQADWVPTLGLNKSTALPQRKLHFCSLIRKLSCVDWASLNQLGVSGWICPNPHEAADGATRHVWRITKQLRFKMFILSCKWSINQIRSSWDWLEWPCYLFQAEPSPFPIHSVVRYGSEGPCFDTICFIAHALFICFIMFHIFPCFWLRNGTQFPVYGSLVNWLGHGLEATLGPRWLWQTEVLYHFVPYHCDILWPCWLTPASHCQRCRLSRCP